MNFVPTWRHQKATAPLHLPVTTNNILKVTRYGHQRGVGVRPINYLFVETRICKFSSKAIVLGYKQNVKPLDSAHLLSNYVSIWWLQESTNNYAYTFQNTKTSPFCCSIFQPDWIDVSKNDDKTINVVAHIQTLWVAGVAPHRQPLRATAYRIARELGI
jgi:hypothetical protein